MWYVHKRRATSPVYRYRRYQTYQYYIIMYPVGKYTHTHIYITAVYEYIGLRYYYNIISACII